MTPNLDLSDMTGQILPIDYGEAYSNIIIGILILIAVSKVMRMDERWRPVRILFWSMLLGLGTRWMGDALYIFGVISELGRHYERLFFVQPVIIIGLSWFIYLMENPWGLNREDNVAIISISETGVITNWNMAATKLLGYYRDEVLGRELASLLIPERYREKHRTGMEKMRGGGTHWVLEKPLHGFALNRTQKEIPVEIIVTKHATPEGTRFMAVVREEQSRKA